MSAQDPTGIPIALANLRSELQAADERLHAADRQRNDVLRRMTAFCPFKLGDVFTAKGAPGEWTVTNIPTSQDGQGWMIGGEIVRHKGQTRQRTYRTFDYRDGDGDTHLTKVPQPTRLA